MSAASIKIRTPGWMGEALCAQTDPEVFFPTIGRAGAEAKRVCAVCPVRQDCLEYGIENGLQGIWGGVGERNRQEERARRAEARAGRPIRTA